MSVTNIRVFAQHLQSQNIQSNLALLSLANYFHNHADPTAELNNQVIDDFLFRALEFEYWQKNRKDLAKELRTQLESFLRHRKANVALDTLLGIDQLQIIAVENMNEFILAAENHFKSLEVKGEIRQCKVINPQQCLMVHAFENGAMRIRQLFPLLYLSRGEVKPIPGVILDYNPQFELAGNSLQSVRLDLFSIASFHKCTLNQNKFKVSAWQGYNFRRTEPVEFENMQKAPKIFNALKRLERHFRDMNSDPYYRSLGQNLKQSADLLQTDAVKYLEKALVCYEQGRLAVEEIFPDDKTLTSLVKELGHQLVIAWQSSQKEARTDQWPNPTTKP